MRGNIGYIMIKALNDMVPVRCKELLLSHPSQDGLCLEVVFLFVRIRQLLKFCNYIGNFAVGLLIGLNGLNVHYLKL